MQTNESSASLRGETVAVGASTRVGNSAFFLVLDLHVIADFDLMLAADLTIRGCVPTPSGCLFLCRRKNDGFWTGGAFARTVHRRPRRTFLGPVPWFDDEFMFSRCLPTIWIVRWLEFDETTQG